MPTVTTIDPVTRLEGHLKIQVTVDAVGGVQQVVDAKATGTLFRGFEQLLRNRHPWDAQHITQRICGVCPVAHGMASVLAQEAAYGTSVPSNARIMRSLVLGANFLQSHILHFYHLAALDFVDGPDMPPWQPSWKADKRLPAATNAALVAHYVTALEMRRKAHELGAIFGGRLPAPPAYIPGGVTTDPTAANITLARQYLNTLIPFINDVLIPDVAALGGAYPEYFRIGAGWRNLLSFGVFDVDASGGTRLLLARGQVANAGTTRQPIDVNAIREHVTYSWYADSAANPNPASGVTIPQYPKPKGYSWLKAPRYQGKPYEAGPLARMWVNGDYRNGVSVMDRHKARAAEAAKVAQAMRGWLDQIVIGGPHYTRSTVPATATGIGLTEAPRGALGHWMQVSGGVISRYQVVTPTCWNASPRDSAGVLGPIEKALVGTPVGNLAEPVEVVRVIHSFDPCLSCAVHVMRPAEGARIFALGHFHGEEEEEACGSDHGHPHSHDHDHGHSHDHAH
jgi:hydrogenase large subunit